MNYIEPKIGTVYDPAHLRQAKSLDELLSLARQGHPLAWAINNCEVRYLAQNDAGGQRFDFSHYEPNEQVWINRQRNDFELQGSLRLAPLDVKDGRPLHYLDHVERFYQQNEYHHVRWDRTQVGDIGFGFWAKNPDKWRWPVEVKAMKIIDWSHPYFKGCAVYNGTVVDVIDNRGLVNILCVREGEGNEGWFSPKDVRLAPPANEDSNWQYFRSSPENDAKLRELAKMVKVEVRVGIRHTRGVEYLEIALNSDAESFEAISNFRITGECQDGWTDKPEEKQS